MGNAQHKDEPHKPDDSESPNEPQEQGTDSESGHKKHRKNLNIAHASVTGIIVCLSIAVIAVSVVAALSSKMYSATDTGRSVGLVALDVSAAIAMTVSLFSTSALWRKRHKQLVLSALALGVIMVAQAVIILACVQVRQHHKDSFSKGLLESFESAQQENQRAVKLWHSTQNELRCCGVLSAEDYKDRSLPLFFAPDIPISCCPSYEPSRNTFMQEREREMCKLKKSYYKHGCRDMVLKSVAYTENTLTVLVAILIIFELLQVSCNVFYIIKGRKKFAKKNGEDNTKNDEKQATKELESKKHTESNVKTKA